MRIRFNRNNQGELVDGELQQDLPLEVRVTGMDISLLSLIWLMIKFIIASAIATVVVALIIMVIGAALNLNFHTFQTFHL